MSFPEWKKVLVVDLGFLGDTVHSIPAIRALALSGAQVDVMTTSVGAELLSLVPEVNRTWIIPLRKPSPPPWKNLGTLCSIRKEKYDGAITFAGSDRNLFCTGWSGARDRVAQLTGRNSWFARWRLTRAVSLRDRTQPVFEQRLAVLRELGWAGENPVWAWRIPKEDAAWIQSQSADPFLHLSISAASSPLNEWPLDGWAEALRGLWQEAPRVKIFATGAGSERENARLRDLSVLTADPRLQIFPERLSIPRLAALVQAGCAHVGLDSGVLHLAVALGKPTVSLFRDSVGRPGWAPRGKNHQVRVSSCSCQESGDITCEGGRARCLAQIPSAEVSRMILHALPSEALG